MKGLIALAIAVVSIYRAVVRRYMMFVKPKWHLFRKDAFIGRNVAIQRIYICVIYDEQKYSSGGSDSGVFVYPVFKGHDCLSRHEMHLLSQQLNNNLICRRLNGGKITLTEDINDILTQEGVWVYVREECTYKAFCKDSDVPSKTLMRVVQECKGYLYRTLVSKGRIPLDTLNR